MARYRYKRRRRGYRRSTNSIMMKFQSFMDISTKADEMQIISISAGGKNILKRLPAQFAAYKYYKIGNIAVKLVPASTLPVDPTGLSITSGDNLVDPRDQLTPGMMRITNGEDVFEDLTGLDADAQHELYNSMMLDPRWFKWMLQTGVKRHATPRYWQIGQLHQDKWPGADVNVPNFNGADHDTAIIDGTYHVEYHGHSPTSPSGHITSNTVPYWYDTGQSSALGIFQTGHRGVLGWLPTDGYQYSQPFITSPPEVEVMKIILPPAYKTKYYYRMYITETVYFKEPILMAMGGSDFPYRPLDVFHINQLQAPISPDYNYSGIDIPDGRTGGNYGDD